MVHTRCYSAAKEVPYLLQYPGEIRNLIYQFVLSSPHALHYYASKTRGCLGVLSPPGPQVIKRHVNQLKKVNRQLRAETSDLELRFNSVYVSQAERRRRGARNETRSEPVLILRLFKDVSARKWSWINKVIVYPPRLDVHAEWKEAMSTRDDVAKLLPNDLLPIIHFVLPSLALGPGMSAALFMLHGLAIAWKLRGDGPSWALLHMVCEEVRGGLREQITGMEHVRFLVPQFRLMPNQKVIDASWIGCAARDVPKSARHRGRLLRHWIYHAVKWTRNGM